MRRAAATILLATLLAAPAGAEVVGYEIVDGRAIPDSLTGGPGDGDLGRELYFDAEATGCSGCHGSPGGPGAQPGAGGQSAPPLNGIAERMSEGEIRLWIVAPRVFDRATAMPGYYAPGQRTNPNDSRFGEPRLRPAEIEALVAYLMRQRGP